MNDIKFLKCKKPQICKACDQPFPKRIIFNGKIVGIQGRRYCLTCSPYTGKRNNARPHILKCRKIINGIDSKLCPSCKQWLAVSEFYLCSSGKLQSNCKSCQSNNLASLQAARKRQMIEFCGGNKCVDCHGIFPHYVYDFHHLDPTQKDFKLSIAYRREWEIVKKELEKCVLLCANCHRIRHRSLDPIQNSGTSD